MLASVSKENGLDWLIAQLDARRGAVDAMTARELLAQAQLTPAQIAPYIEPRAGSYARRSVVRREHYEVLVLTWLPGQESVAHDHSGSLCGLKVAQGRMTEQLYELGADGQARATASASFLVGGITVDPGIVVHALSNPAASGETLVTVHLYSPPLPEVRRYAVSQTPPASVFVRRPPPGAKTVAIVGGGFTGTMTLANLLRHAKEGDEAMHFVLIDRQPAAGEGIAYRTNDGRHLLNVPAGKMSAWPDRPDDFLDFARASDSSVKPGDFLPRKMYGQYVRKTLLDLAKSADERVSVEMIRDEAAGLKQGVGDWRITTAAGREIRADLTIIALGHRPPGDEFSRRWIGPRHHFVADPWAALVLSQIGPEEPVLLLGSGLTAVDVILTLDRGDRIAPMMVVSRHGLMPQPHLRDGSAPADCADLVAGWLNKYSRLTTRTLVQTLRGRAAEAASQGIDWRQVVDGLRGSAADIWKSLDTIERERFLRHVRPFWEIHRHRMAPDVAERIARLRSQKILDVTAGTLLSATADDDGITARLRHRGSAATRELRVAWVINCTGPGWHNRHNAHPLLRPLIQSGTLCDDPLGLGIPTDAYGRALDSRRKPHTNLLVAGTLRKSTLWESTAVPELRQQAATVAQIALKTLTHGEFEAEQFSI